ncbi:MAG: sulfatase, partial [Planctomycetota bacterium]
AQSAIFKNAYAPAPYTLPSHVSLFTSLYPTVHGIQDKSAGTIPPEACLLAERLAGEGWITGSFNGGGYVSHDFGFHRGFDLYCEVDPLGDQYLNGYVMHKEQVFADGTAGSFSRALSWLETMKDQRFFLFLHTFMIHDFQPPNRYADEYARHLPPALKPGKKLFDSIKGRYHNTGKVTDDERKYIVNMYDGGIKASDDMIGALLAHIHGLGIEEETVVILLSDHGEEFLDHGELNHNRTLYEEMIRVPLIIRIPGRRAGSVSESQVSLVDVVPTVLDLLGIRYDERSCGGRSLQGLIEGAAIKDPIVYAEVDVPEFSKRSCVIEDRWKYIEGSTEAALKHPAPAATQLFDLRTDPHEKQDLSETDPEKRERLEKLLEAEKENRLRKRKAMKIDNQVSLPLDPELLEMLKQQGYL